MILISSYHNIPLHGGCRDKDSKIFIDEPDEEVFEDFKSITHTVKETILHSNPQFAVAVFWRMG